MLFGDCGSKGALDRMLEEYPDIEHISGSHCYEFYSGELFVKLMEEEPGTYFLTDFMVRTFQGLIVKSMGLDRFPQLKQEYFRNSLDTLIGLLKIKLVQLKLGHRILLDTLQVSFAIWDFHKLFLTILENHINMSITLKQLRRT